MQPTPVFWPKTGQKVQRSDAIKKKKNYAAAGEKDEAAGASAAAALEEEYDDAAEPEPEEGDAEEGALLQMDSGTVAKPPAPLSHHSLIVSAKSP